MPNVENTCTNIDIFIDTAMLMMDLRVDSIVSLSCSNSMHEASKNDRAAEARDDLILLQGEASLLPHELRSHNGHVGSEEEEKAQLRCL